MEHERIDVVCRVVDRETDAEHHEHSDHSVDGQADDGVHAENLDHGEDCREEHQQRSAQMPDEHRDHQEDGTERRDGVANELRANHIERGPVIGVLERIGIDAEGKAVRDLVHLVDCLDDCSSVRVELAFIVEAPDRGVLHPDACTGKGSARRVLEDQVRGVAGACGGLVNPGREIRVEECSGCRKEVAIERLIDDEVARIHHKAGGVTTLVNAGLNVRDEILEPVREARDDARRVRLASVATVLLPEADELDLVALNVKLLDDDLNVSWRAAKVLAEQVKVSAKVGAVRDKVLAGGLHLELGCFEATDCHKHQGEENNHRAEPL
mmetsp:Transcript_26167/g.74146  ORF Transcript_26167/g.74146 Transcript_26167/m.74146 type:complete len:325 (+) Transcript_26167:552-1526(+)